MSSSLCRILNFWAAPSLFPHDAALRWNGKMLLSHVFTNQRWQQYSWIIVTTGVNDNVCWPSQHNTLHHQLWRGRVNRGRESENKLQLKSSVWLSAAQMWLGGVKPIWLWSQGADLDLHPLIESDRLAFPWMTYLGKLSVIWVTGLAVWFHACATAIGTFIVNAK